MRPALLVHGYLASPGLMLPMRRRLRAYGHDVRLVHELSPLVVGDVRDHAKELDRAVERVRRETGADRVDLVGASQGGIIALWWASVGNWDRLGRLVALGSPFRGSPVAPLARPLLRRLSAGIEQIVPGADVLATLAATPLERPVTSISMDNDPVCPPTSCLLPGMEPVVVPGWFGPLSHQLLMLDPRATRAVHEALTC